MAKPPLVLLCVCVVWRQGDVRREIQGEEVSEEKRVSGREFDFWKGGSEQVFVRFPSVEPIAAAVRVGVCV